MNKRGWSDKQVEDCIRFLPKVTDDRDPRDIYQNVSMKIKQKRRKAVILPGFAAVAAALLLFLLLSSEVFDKNPGKEVALEEKRGPDSAEIAGNNDQAGITSKKGPEVGAGNQNAGILAMPDSKESASALYEEEVAENQAAVTVWVPDKDVNYLVPVSVTVPKESGKNWLDHFKTAMAGLKESEWGLKDYYPLDVEFSLEGEDTLVVNVPAGHQFGMSTTTEGHLIDSLKENLTSNSTVTKIKFMTEGNLGIELSHMGPRTIEPVERKRNRAYFFARQEGREQPYLVPSNEQYPDVSKALDVMKTGSENGPFLASIPPSLDIKDVAPNGDTLSLTLADNAVLENSPDNQYSFEAILMAAKEFGFKEVKIENAPIQQLGPFNLAAENKVPIGPNKMHIQ
ncbi:GerMN domain-containing protein [Neobacillus sp. SCS-31]|uniref:GerMN domain-containing protein n=1 Tax=Neobacillus oceani TaxID=3115292 RepID=UPI00390601A9